MNETGPDAVPPPARLSREDRRLDRFVPVPEPYLKSMPSVLASVRMESSVSSTELMKQADICGCGSIPQLNHTGLLNAPCWWTSRCLRSSLKACRSASPAKYRPSRAQAEIVSTTRPINCLTLHSRSGEPTAPRKYFDTTMFVACCDQNRGTSTPRCSNTASPRSLAMTASRRSQSIWS